MRVFPLSDLHGDVGHKAGKNHPYSKEFMKEYWSDFIGTDPILFCACGDLGEGLTGVVWAERMLSLFPNLQICYVPGNHEYYGRSIEDEQFDLSLASATSDRLYILDGITNSAITISENGKKVCTVVGGTLWTDFNKQDHTMMQEVQSSMMDYKRIYSGFKFNKITPERILQEHYIIRKNIFKQIERANKELPVIVMTHHVPYTPKVITNAKSYGYYVDLTEDMNNLERVPEFWFSGHSHRSEVHRQEFTNGVCEYISNQIGYAHELSSGFSLDVCAEV